MGANSYLVLAFQLLATTALLILVILWPTRWDLARGIGSVLAVIGIVLVVTARFQLGKSFSITPQARSLVKHGLYSKIRNPIYIFGTVALVGLILILHRPSLCIYLGVLIAIQILRARKEAKVLEAKFGESYREYRRKTWF